MSRVSLAFSIFFRLLGDGDLASRLRAWLDETDTPESPDTAGTQQPAARGPKESPRSKRSEALTLLESLQREARLLDFLMEPLDAYSDEQVGAAVRDVHRDSAQLVHRCFAPEALRSEAEGQEITLDSAGPEVKLSGRVDGQAPYRGVLRHHGWRAARCELPVWQGDAEGERVLAPAEVEIQ